MLGRLSLASWALAALVGAVVGLGVACGSDESSGTGGGCTPGAQQACACPAGGQGTQVCNEDGRSFGACDCGGEGGNGAGGGAVGLCGDGVEQSGECDPGDEVNYCPVDCMAGAGGAGGDPCAGQNNYAGLTAPKPSVWQQGGLTSVEAGDAMCDVLQPGAGLHVCEYQQLRAAEAEALFLTIPAGTTIWIHRTSPEMVNGMMSMPGPGGRCNDWTYSTNHISDGEYATFDAVGVPTYHLDNDTFYDGIDGTHTITGDLNCGPVDGLLRAIACCYPVCVP